MTPETLTNGSNTYRMFRGDCLEEMAAVSDASCDMALVDLPYGTTACPWDSVIPFEKVWELLYRICKPNAAMVMFAGEPFTSSLIMSNVKHFRQKLTWLKTRPTNVMNAKKMFMNWTEDVCIFYRSLPKFRPQMRTDGEFTGRKVQHTHTDRSLGTLGKTGENEGYVHEGNGGMFYPKTVLEFSNVHHGDDCHHPTQKPVALLEYLIRTYTDENDTVCDITMGSGSTGVACANLFRSFVGCEKDETYYHVANKRITRSVFGVKTLTLL